MFGQAGDIPVVSNWSGTGTADQLGVYRQGTWYVDSNGNNTWDAASDIVFSYGSAGDIPVTEIGMALDPSVSVFSMRLASGTST